MLTSAQRAKNAQRQQKYRDSLKTSRIQSILLSIRVKTYELDRLQKKLDLLLKKEK